VANEAHRPVDLARRPGIATRDAATYTCRYADSDLTSASASAFNAGLYADWATVYAKTIGANTCGESNALNGSSGGAPSELATNPYSYWALAHTALAFAVDLGAPGATESWQRLVSASNYAPATSGIFHLVCRASVVRSIEMKRREFIAGTAGLIGSVLPVIGRSQSKPCPPPRCTSAEDLL